MPLILTVAGQKGGTGKTTITVNLAEGFRLAGRKTVILDTDNQGSAQVWRGIAEEQEHPETTGVYGISEGKNLRKALADFEHVDVILIDTPPLMGPEARAAMGWAHAVLIPVSPGPADVWALSTVIRTIDEIRAGRRDDGPRVLAVLNRLLPQSTLSQRLAEDVAASGFPVAKTQLVGRVAYAEAKALGLSILTYKHATQGAIDEVNGLLAEVTTLLEEAAA